MSETIIDPSGSLANEGRTAGSRSTGSRLLDEHGQAVKQATQAASGTLDQMGAYVREQPVSTALLALGIGYIVGRLRLI